MRRWPRAATQPQHSPVAQHRLRELADTAQKPRAGGAASFRPLHHRNREDLPGGPPFTSHLYISGCKPRAQAEIDTSGSSALTPSLMYLSH